jgi:hypothetical protein
VTGAELAEVVAAARALVAYSDARDRESAARLAARAEGYAAGYEAGDHAGREAVHEWYAEQDREVSAAAAAVLNRPAPAAVSRHRWHVCCRPCRRGGHRDGCTRCEDRTCATFGDPHPDDYPGTVTRVLPTALVGNGAADTRRGAA